MKIRAFGQIAVAAIAAAGCTGCASSSGAATSDEAPNARPLAAELARQAKDAPEPGAPDPRSPSRVLAYIEGEVITYREVLQLVGPELAQIDDPKEKAQRADEALIDILRERMLYRAAGDASVHASRDEVDADRARFVNDLAKNGGTLAAFLNEHEMSRREFDEMIRESRFVRATVDTWNPSEGYSPITGNTGRFPN